MADPLLSSLCRICHIHTPKYTCPRCSLQTCSLPCSRRHKIWSSCSGIRDPTVYKPLSEVATPSGIDHDYNFLHSIEHKIERSEKDIVEDRGLVDKKELQAARTGIERRRRRQNKGDESIKNRLRETRIRVDKAPVGMKRNLDNGTSWSKNRKSINWQVEWICGDKRLLSKVLDTWPLADAYDEFLEEERRKTMTQDDKKAEWKKRKFEEGQEKEAKRIKMDTEFKSDGIARPFLQDSVTSAWNLRTAVPSIDTENFGKPKNSKQRYFFYLHRPYTPSSFPKVVIPLDRSQPLRNLLEQRTLLEFPTIYVLEDTPEDDLPENFMLEKDFFAATGQGPLPIPEGSSDEESSGQDSEDNTSSSEGEDLEEGEII